MRTNPMGENGDMNGKPIAITMGDAAGIGPEIIAKAFRDHEEVTRGCFVAGDVDAIRRGAHAVAGGMSIPVARIDDAAQAFDVPPRCVPVLPVVKLDPLPAHGAVSAAAGRAAADSVIWAARAAIKGEIAAIVTAPLHKEALAAAGIPFPGHTELLQAEAGGMPVRMMLANDELRTVLVSIHVSLRDAIEAVTIDNVLDTLRIAHDSLTRALGKAPRIGVAGLNPHAGEAGLFGREEIEAISPAIAVARAEGLVVSGPIAPDTVFMRARKGEFDVVVAMYHDQGLIPVKYLGVEKGVNVTLGLPLVRTSPDHGTAFGIAGTGRADPGAFVAAIRMAGECAARRTVS